MPNNFYLDFYQENIRAKRLLRKKSYSPPSVGIMYNISAVSVAYIQGRHILHVRFISFFVCVYITVYCIPILFSFHLSFLFCHEFLFITLYIDYNCHWLFLYLYVFFYAIFLIIIIFLIFNCSVFLWVAW